MPANLGRLPNQSICQTQMSTKLISKTGEVISKRCSITVACIRTGRELIQAVLSYAIAICCYQSHVERSNGSGREQMPTEGMQVKVPSCITSKHVQKPARECESDRAKTDPAINTNTLSCDHALLRSKQNPDCLITGMQK